MKRLFLSLLCALLSFSAPAGNDTICKADTTLSQSDSSSIVHRRITTMAIAGGVAYGGLLIVISDLNHGYKLQSCFHFNKDKEDWRMGMDKAHHAIASYYIARLGYGGLRWAGLTERRSTWVGGLSGFFFLSTQEIIDGFSSEWGASIGDLAGNAFGPALFISQQLAWHEQKILLKWSYHATSFPDYSPVFLGNNFAQKMIKDYNGQTFWLSANLHGFTGRESGFPRWFNVALGYGATGMTGPINDPSESGRNSILSFDKRHLFYIAPDVDLSRIHTRSVALKWVFEAIGFLKFPLPALEISRQGVRFYPVFF